MVRNIPAHQPENDSLHVMDSTKVSPEKRLGLLAGKLDIPDDFDAPLPDDVVADFYGIKS